MICVVEGADGSGKTTLAKNFEARGFEYRHTGVPAAEDDVFEVYTRALLDAQAAGRDVVFDRLHVGELVYGPVMRGASHLSVEQLRLLNRLLFGGGGALVLCDTTNARLEARWTRRQAREYLPTLVHLRQVIQEYRVLAATELRLPGVLTYDYADDPAQGGLALLRGILARPSCPPGVIGYPGARFLFVGERVNAARDLAFYSLTNSSGFFNGCLWEAGFLEPELAFTNALAQDGAPRNLEAAWLALPRANIVALGRVAQDVCAKQGLPFLRLPHPQYVKRFKRPTRAAYVKQLRELRGEARQ